MELKGISPDRRNQPIPNQIIFSAACTLAANEDGSDHDNETLHPGAYGYLD